MHQSGDKVSCSQVQNKEIATMEVELEQFYKTGSLNGINLYLYGLILKERNKKREAIRAFIEALNKQPMLWSAWLELSDLMTASESRWLFSQFRQHWMLNFFCSNWKLENQEEGESMNYTLQLLR